MSSDDVVLAVDGLTYRGWKSIRVTQSFESLAGSFALEVSDRWGGLSSPWPIVEEDACRVKISDDVVIDGYVDKRSLGASPSSRTLTYTGRDRAGVLVDCSILLDKWTYRNVTLLEFATTIAKPFGIKVSVQAGLALMKRDKIVVNPGDKAYEALAREATEEGVMLVSDGAGGVVITRDGTERADPLVEGVNLKGGSAEYDGANRFYRYVVASSPAATDAASGDATRVKAEATDEGVRRKDRVLLIRPDKGYSVAAARRRADWEARIRAARAETVTAVVQGWRQSNGRLWRINAVTNIQAPRMLGVDGDMRISQVEYTVDSNGGTVTQLRLVRPDAFTPEPKATVAARPSGWPELREGA